MTDEVEVVPSPLVGSARIWLGADSYPIAISPFTAKQFKNTALKLWNGKELVFFGNITAVAFNYYDPAKQE